MDSSSSASIASVSKLISCSATRHFQPAANQEAFKPPEVGGEACTQGPESSLICGVCTCECVCVRVSLSVWLVGDVKCCGTHALTRCVRSAWDTCSFETCRLSYQTATHVAAVAACVPPPAPSSDDCHRCPGAMNLLPRKWSLIY